MNESRYLLMRVGTYLRLAWHIAFGKARLRGERVISRQIPPLQGVGGIDGDARSRYLLPCEIERRPLLSENKIWIFLAGDSQSLASYNRHKVGRWSFIRYHLGKQRLLMQGLSGCDITD